MLRAYSSKEFKPYHAQGLDLSTLTAADQNRLDSLAERVIADQNRHQPWVLKDPRMLFFAEAWIAKVQRCLFFLSDHSYHLCLSKF